MTSHGSGQVKELAGRVALVTGGAVRIGREIACALADAGADVAVGYHRSSSDARATVRDLEARGVRAVALRSRGMRLRTDGPVGAGERSARSRRGSGTDAPRFRR